MLKVAVEMSIPPILTESPLDEFAVHVVFNTSSPTGLFHLRLAFEAGRFHQKDHAVQAGQFLMLDVQDENGFRFRRPYSLMSWNQETQEGDIIYKVVGEGSKALSRWQVGQKSVALASLGNAFPIVAGQNPRHTILLAGGVGLAPLILWAEEGRQKGWQDDDMPTLVFGVRSQAEAQSLLPHLARLIPLDKLLLCSDDGSLGFHGHVVACLEDQAPEDLAHFEHAFVCGPTPMMNACVKTASQLLPNANVYVSLENHMPCGTGACFGCVVGQAHEGLPLKVCEAGPVFEASQLLWGEKGLDTVGFAGACDAFPRFETATSTEGGVQ